MANFRDDIFRIIRQNIDVIRGFGVRKLGIFGSYARGDQRPDSDLDFLVELEKNTFDSYMGLCLFLEDLFRCEIDLVISDSIRPELRDTILNEVIYVQGI